MANIAGPAIIAFEKDMGTAGKIQAITGGEIIPYSEDAFRKAFEYDAVIAIMACGIAVRKIAPYLSDKWTDPPVVVVDSGLRWAIPVSGGHHGGNELARKLSDSGAVPVITTATEAAGKVSVEEIADKFNCRMVNRESTKKVNLSILENDVEVDILHVRGPKIVIVDTDVSVLQIAGEPRRNNSQSSSHSGCMNPGLVIGIGTCRGIEKNKVMAAIRRGLEDIGANLDDVRLLASAEIKENEKGIIQAAKELGKDMVFVPHEIINSIETPSVSKAESLGLKGVCEPCALAVSKRKKLLLQKKVYEGVTIAIAE